MQIDGSGWPNATGKLNASQKLASTCESIWPGFNGHNGQSFDILGGKKCKVIDVCTCSLAMFVSTLNLIILCLITDPPSKPQDVVTKTTCNSIAISWSAPLSINGAFPVTQYFLDWGIGSITLPPDSTKYLITGLNGNTFFNIILRADSDVGRGAPVKRNMVRTDQFCEYHSSLGDAGGREGVGLEGATPSSLGREGGASRERVECLDFHQKTFITDRTWFALSSGGVFCLAKLSRSCPIRDKGP